jgi:hypothetical protein
MSVQHANRGIVKKDLQLYYNREFSKSFRGEATTNLITNTVASTGGWDGNLFNNWVNATVALNVDMAPDGTMTAIKLTGGYSRWTDSITVAASTTYTASIWLKNINLSVDPQIRIATGLNGTLVNYTTNVLAVSRSTITSWRRVSVSVTIPASGVNQIQFGVTFSDAHPHSTSILVWGAQFEKKAYMTQYSNLATDYFSRNETITNLLTTTYSSLPTNWSVDSSGQGTIGSYSYIENNSAIRIVDVNSNTRFNTGYVSGFSASTTYTFSVKYRKVSGTPTLRFQIQFYNSSNVVVGSVSFPTTLQIHIYNIDEWQLAWFTVTSPASTAKVLWFIQDGDDYTGYTHSYDLKEPQIQTGTYPTKYASNTSTANTLASGGGLLDISGNNVNADLTNATFNSAGYVFSGSQYITVPYSSNLDRNDFTIAGYCRTSTNDDTHDTIVSRNSDVYATANGWNISRLRNGLTTANAFRFMIYGDSTTASQVQGPAISDNVWRHFAVVVDKSVSNTATIYINGILYSTLSSLPVGNHYPSSGSPPLYIGCNKTTADLWNGDIAQILYYQKALTAAEVLQNFNATRTTYGI